MIWNILFIWLAFDALVFFLVWFDYVYYRHNLPGVCRKVLDAFVEEDGEE